MAADSAQGTYKVDANTNIMTPLANVRNNVANSSASPDKYSSSTAYKVGDMVIQNDILYKCTTACSAASWAVNSACFTATTLASVVTQLNNDLNMKTYLDNSSEVTITSGGVFDFIAIRIGRLLYIRGTFQHSNNIVKIKISDVKFNKTTNHSNNIANNKFMAYTSGAQNMSRLLLTTAVSNDQHEVTWSGITSSYPYLIVDNVFILDN